MEYDRIGDAPKNWADGKEEYQYESFETARESHVDRVEGRTGFVWRSFSLLPLYRGKSPWRAALWRGGGAG